MFVRQDKDKNWYICRRTSKRCNGNIWLIKSNPNINIQHTTSIKLPKQFIGKRVRLKVEIVEIPRK